MADTILTGDVTVAYIDESRQKRIYETGGNNRYSLNSLYSALMDHFDEPSQMDNPSPMSAQTPVEYTTGIIDTGDDEPWYVSYRLMEKIFGGALKTTGWARDLPGDGSGAIGIVVVPVASAAGTIVYSDEGDTLSHASGDVGTLLEFIDTGGATDYLVIRPNSNALADDFDTGSGVITMDTSGFVATQNAVAVTGEQIWANLYAIGTIESNTHLYAYQGSVDGAARSRIFSQNSATSDYWDNGLFDVCIPIRDYTLSGSPVIDAGFISVFARKGTTEYSNFETTTSLTSGGRNPIPLGTKRDLNQTTGTGNLVWDNGTADTILDLGRLYKVGTTTVGNIAAGVQDDGGVFTDDTTDLADVGGAGDVPIHPAITAINDAFYFGMPYKFGYLVVDINTIATATAPGTTWEYWDGAAWSALTVVDSSDSANGFATAGTGRRVVSWDIPTDWTPIAVTNQPAVLVKPYYVRIRVSNATNYTVGALVETGWAAGEKQLKAIVRDSSITTPSGAGGNTDYYLVGEPQSDFSDNDVVLAIPSRKVFDIAGAPTSQGPALATWFTNNAFPSISFTAQTFDVDDDATDEFWGIDIDCNSNPLVEVYEWLKYILRNGGTTTANSDGIEGEQYIGGTAVLAYTVNDAGDLAEGDYVTQETSGASGIIVSMDETTGTNWLLLRDTRGTFITGATLATLTNASTGSVEINTTAEGFAPNSVAPFGAFAGGRFFGARGVLLSNWVAANENSFQLTPIEGGTKERPIAITLTVSNLVGTDETTATDDRVAIFRLTGAGGQINKTEYSAAGGEAIGDNTLTVDGAIAQDVPGKTAGGVVRIRDESNNNQEYRLRYSSWTGSIFTLAAIEGLTLAGGTDTDTVVSSASDFATAKRGDLVNNITQGAISYVVSVDDANTIQISPAIVGQTSGDTIEINTCPVAINTLDDVFVPLMDTFATSGTQSISMVYSAPVFFRVVARNSANATKIIPFTANDTTSGTDRSNSVVRNTDTIIT